MTTKSSEPREWDIFRIGEYNCGRILAEPTNFQEPIPYPVMTKVYHVIEYSAFEKLQAENERLKGIEKDHMEDWKRIQKAERELALQAEVARLQGENEHLEMVIDSKQEFLESETECRKLRERQLELVQLWADYGHINLYDLLKDRISALELEANENGVKS